MFNHMETEIRFQPSWGSAVKNTGKIVLNLFCKNFLKKKIKIFNFFKKKKNNDFFFKVLANTCASSSGNTDRASVILFNFGVKCM